jgi:ADP-ribosylglycohydrolase
MNSFNSTAARRSLEGLSVGDAFGELFFFHSPHEASLATLPSRPWPWTDDTHMALSIVETLELDGLIDQDALAARFAARFAADPLRGYARGAAHLLERVGRGESWRVISPTLFGSGSYGNGGAMRVAPLGAFFAADMERVVREAAASAEVTHAHPEGKAGAVAVAVATALALTKPDLRGEQFLRATLPFVPDGETMRRIEYACSIPGCDLSRAMLALGTGVEVSAQDTVPFCLWSAAHHLGQFEAALWNTAKGYGDVDTTCAIVGGIVAASVAEVPAHLIARRERLPPLARSARTAQ